MDATAEFSRAWSTQEGSNHPEPLARQVPRFPAVWVEIWRADQPGAPPERRVVLDGIDAVEHDLQKDYTHPDLALTLAWDLWAAPGPPRYLLHWTDDGSGELLSQGPDGPLRVAVRPGEALPLPGARGARLTSLHTHATFEKNLSFLPPSRPAGWDADFYSPLPKGVELTVIHEPDTPDETRESVRMASTEASQSNLWFSGDGRFALRFLENSEMLPFEWRSVLSILERGPDGGLQEVPLGGEARREIRVNDYFKHGGYRFFQTNADARFPTYSGVGVVYDPGIPIVLIGMWTIIAGTAIAFLVRPIVLARRRSDP